MNQIIIDSRESKLIDLFEKNTIETKNLLLGDIHLILHNDCQILIERKTIHDFWQSILDNRLKEQRARLKEWMNEKNKVIYIIEYDKEIESEKLNTIERSIHRLNFIHQIMIKKVNTIKDTQEYIIWLSKQDNLFKQTDFQKDKLDSWLKSIIPKKKDIQTPENLIIVLLMSINGISYNIAKQITLECKNINQYIEKIKNYNIKNFSEIMIDNKKQLGMKKAKNIYNLLGIEN